MQIAQNSNGASQNAAQNLFPTLTPGQKLAGCYLLKERKYTSNASSIWLAHDEVLGKDVALHFIPQPVLGDEKAMDELRHLTKRNRQLIHPNILRIYDFIEEGDWAAVSTDSVEGDCLADLRSKRTGGHFEIADVKPWLAQLCQTLDDAHKIQLVHGDLSPEHLFLGEGGKLVAMNFGIGRCVRDAAWRIAGTSGGSPPVENLSPQLLDGQPPVASDDIYATGILLHELLVGQPPFTEPDIAGKIRDATAAKVLERRSELQRAGGPVPPNWEKVIAACLEKTADQRPRSLADLSGRLGLPTAGAAPDDVAEVSTPREPALEPEAMAQEPVIPVVKKAWVGASAAKVERPTADFSRTEVDMTDPDDSIEQEPVFKNSSAKGFSTAVPRRSGFPFTGVAAAAVLGGLCIYAVYSSNFGKGTQKEMAPVVNSEAGEVTPYAPAKKTVSAPIAETAPTIADTETPPSTETVSDKLPVASVASVEASAHEVKTVVIEPPVVAATFSPKPEIDPALTLVANTKAPKNLAPAQATPVPAAAATEGGTSVSAKTAALEAARKSVEEWEKAHAAMLKKKEQAEAAIAEAKKVLGEKMKVVGPLLKASDEVAAMKQKREEEARVAELAAAEAKKAAEEKARFAEEAKKAVFSVERDNKDKLAEQKRAESELDVIKKSIAENERHAAESAKLADGALAKKAEQITLVKQREQEVAVAMAAAEIETQKKREMEEKRSRILKEMDDAKKLFEERMKSLESSLKDPEASAAPAKPEPEKAPIEAKPVVPATPPPAASVPVTPVAPTPAPEAAKPAVAATPPTLPAADSTLLAKMDKVPAVPAVEPKPATSATTSPALNSLGIAFVPVGDVQFAVWPTRLRDFEAFATATNLKSNLWRDPGFKQDPEHPVVNVTWMEAMMFCKWLTLKEQREGTLPTGKAYRLPTDLEWSRAVGLTEETGKTAEARDMGVPDVYPWGTAWPPPQGAGNYTGEETGSDVAIKGYSDGFPWTSPVGSFPPNKYGIYDMGGNVWQWVMDQWNTDSSSKVLRGASWYNGALKLSLLSSCRVHAAQDSSTDNYGFRCVIAAESPKAAKR